MIAMFPRAKRQKGGEQQQKQRWEVVGEMVGRFMFWLTCGAISRSDFFRTKRFAFFGRVFYKLFQLVPQGDGFWEDQCQSRASCTPGPCRKSCASMSFGWGVQTSGKTQSWFWGYSVKITKYTYFLHVARFVRSDDEHLDHA